MFIDWPNKIINILKSDMLLVESVPTPIYQLDLTWFHFELRKIEATGEGMAFLKTHTHNAPVQVGGANLARVIIIVNGYTVTFEDDSYIALPVGANSNILNVFNKNQVSIGTSNSAGLQDLNSLQAASFLGEVTVKSDSPFDGIVFPVGTRQFPVNNMDDAHAIADSRGIGTFRFLQNMTLTSRDYSDGHTFLGDTNAIVVTIEDGANVSNCTFLDLTVQGVLDNNNTVKQCNILDLLEIRGFIFQCAFNGTITLGGDGQVSMLQCFSNIPGGSTPTIDLGGGGQDLALRDYVGGITFTNHTTPGTDEVSIDMSSGTVIIDPTVTTGTMYVRGIAEVIDNSGPGATIIDSTVLSKVDNLRPAIAAAVWDEPTGDHLTPGTTGKKLKDDLKRSDFLALK